MEYASYLAGERWSDHPACTHPSLAFLARMVNDCTTDGARSRLGRLIPSVIGLIGDDPRTPVLVALRAATAALPVACEERQRALATGILCCEQVLARAERMADDHVDRCIKKAFDQAPHAERWAREFVKSYPAQRTQRSIARITESLISIAVLGIAQACVSNPDERLRDVLETAIDDCTRLLRPAPAESRAESREQLLAVG